MRTLPAAWWVGGAVVGVGVLALAAASPAGRAVARRVEATVQGWSRNVIAWVSRREGKPDSLNRNLDGNGLSYGILQWTQKSGNLGILLAAMREADPAGFASIFGTEWRRVVEVTARGSLEPVDGANLWEEPWASRFTAAGRHAPFVEVQWSLAQAGDHWRGAEDVAARLGVRTERSMTLFFDRSVHQGPAGVARTAERLLAGYARDGRSSVPYLQLLVDFSAFSAAPFRRTTQPTSPYYSSRATHITWQPVGQEWHAVTGPFDLYESIVRRTNDILRDRSLGDSPLPVVVPG